MSTRNEVTRFRPYGAYGYRVAFTVDAARSGFAGDIREVVLSWYWMGARVYIPWLRRFISPDAHSPFGRGGANRHTFCGGDPINRIDPTGHAWWNWLFTGLAIVAGAIVTVASAGTLSGVVAAAVAGSITAAVSTTTVVTLAAATVIGVASIAVEIGSGIAMETGDMKTSSILGYVGMGLGFASALTALPSAMSSTGKFVGRGIKALMGLSKSGRGTRASTGVFEKVSNGLKRAAQPVTNMTKQSSRAMSNVYQAKLFPGAPSKLGTITIGHATAFTGISTQVGEMVANTIVGATMAGEGSTDEYERYAWAVAAEQEQAAIAEAFQARKREAARREAEQQSHRLLMESQPSLYGGGASGGSSSFSPSTPNSAGNATETGPIQTYAALDAMLVTGLNVSVGSDTSPYSGGHLLI